MPDKDAQDCRPSTPLMEAVLLEDEAEAYRWAKELLEAGEDPNQLDLVYQQHPISEAWSSDRIELIKLLLEYGARPALIHDEPFETAQAFIACSIDATLLMLEKGLRLSGLYQYSPMGERLGWCDNLLAKLLLIDDQEKIEALEPFGIMEFINVYDDLGNLPLGTMAQRGDRKIARWLLDHGADINAHSESMIGYTALDRAVHNHDVRMVEFLLNHGANPTIPTWMWKTAIHESIEMDGRDLKRKPNQPPSEYTTSVYKLVLDACKKFPPPTYPDGRTPEVWPPEHKTK